ncbi:hypothetical protein EGT81_05180 [Alcaligenes faecalis]|nr:hypothetical protein EGT81_05180 [Alcaligenes faecalis]
MGLTNSAVVKTFRALFVGVIDPSDGFEVGMSLGVRLREWKGLAHDAHGASIELGHTMLLK